jgi:hypothetical protein
MGSRRPYHLHSLIMAKRILFAGLALFPFLACAQSDLETHTGNWLYDRYLGFQRQEAADSWMYALYVSGVVDRQFISQQLERTPPKWCRPQGGATLAHDLHIVGQYLERYPARRHYPSAQLVIESFQEAWPCPSAERQSSGPQN